MAAVRGPGGRFLSKAEREAAATAATHTTSNTTTIERENNNMSATDTGTPIEFVDELPSIHRTRDGGVWVDRLEPLRDNPGKWAKVGEATKNPHALVNNLRQGSAAGIDPDDYQFAGRMLPADDDVDPDKVNEDGKTGYVFARFLTDEQRAERDAKRAERQARAEAGEDVGDEDEDE